MIPDAVMLFEPDGVEAQLFPVNCLLKSFSEVCATFGGNESKFHSSPSHSVMQAPSGCNLVDMSITRRLSGVTDGPGWQR